MVALSLAYERALRSPSYLPATTLCAGSSGTFDVDRLRQRSDARSDALFLLGSDTTSYNAKQIYGTLNANHTKVRTVVHEESANVPDRSAFHLTYEEFAALQPMHAGDSFEDLEEQLLRMPLARFCRDLLLALRTGATVLLDNGVSARRLLLQSVFPTEVLERIANCHHHCSPRVELSLSPPEGMGSHRDCSLMARRATGGGEAHIAPSITLPVPFNMTPTLAFETHVILSDIEMAIPMGCFGKRGCSCKFTPRAAIFAASMRRHETAATPAGYVALVSTGWEEYSYRHPANTWGF